MDNNIISLHRQQFLGWQMYTLWYSIFRTAFDFWILHSKNNVVELDPEIRLHCGHTPFRVNDDPEISKLDVEYDSQLGESDPLNSIYTQYRILLSEPIICQLRRKLTKFRVTFDPELSTARMDHFPGHAKDDHSNKNCVFIECKGL